jgi:hypothetical protein
VRLTRLFEVVSAWALAGCLPPDNPPEKPKPVDPDVAALVHDWKVVDHVLPMKTTQEDDASRMHGRIVSLHGVV